MSLDVSTPVEVQPLCCTQHQVAVGLDLSQVKDQGRGGDVVQALAHILCF